MNKIIISTEFIKLDSFMKFSGMTADGAAAKRAIADGEVKVNGECCLMRGKKLRAGDIVIYSGEEYEVAAD